MENFNLTNYIKSQLDNSNENYSTKNELRRQCLKNIGKAFSEYLNYDLLVNEMSDSSINELEEAISRISFQRKSFTEFIPCSREEANKEGTDLRSVGLFTWGEYGEEYGYFKHKKKLTEEQEEWLEEHTECCYYHGQPCWVWQKEESDIWDEDCECRLGRDLSSLILYELDEEEEKRLGVWQQDIKWSLNGYGNININYYYSLDILKKDAMDECDHKLKDNNDKCYVCNFITNYNGKKSWSKGNIKIKVINDKSDSDSNDEEILLIKSDKDTKTKQVHYFDSEPDNLNDIVGGYFTFLKTKDGRMMAINEEGILKKLPLNEEATELVGQEVLGNVAVFPTN